MYNHLNFPKLYILVNKEFLSRKFSCNFNDTINLIKIIMSTLSIKLSTLQSTYLSAS